MPATGGALRCRSGAERAKHLGAFQKFCGGGVFLVGNPDGDVLFPLGGLERQDGVHAVIKNDGMESFVFQVSFYDVGLKKSVAFGNCFHTIKD